jgi:putative transposase
MQLSIPGEIAIAVWLEIPHHFPNVILDEFVVMPNHVHGILIIDRSHSDDPNPPDQRINDRGGITHHHNPMINHDSLGAIVRWYKGRTTHDIRSHLAHFAWQPRFHDHIIRDSQAIDRIRHYIRNNPRQWSADKFWTT